jgi:hypothetical protein
MNRRHRTALLVATLIVVLLLPTLAFAAPPASTAPVSAASGATPTRVTTTGPGVQVGPAPPASTTPTQTTTVGGDKASHPAFWDLPGRVKQAINDWFKSLALDALTPMLDLVGKTVLATPDLAANPQVAGLWQISLIAADALLVLFLLVGAGVAMSHDSLQSQYALKDLIRRLFFAGIVINASLSLSGQLITVANALAGAFLGDGASAAASTGSLQTLVVGALAGGGIFLTLLGLGCAVAAVILVVLYLLRTAIVVLLVCAAPLMLLCHLFPQTESLAQLWWKAITACLAVQVSQALVLAAAVRVFFAGSGGGGLGLTVSGSVVNMLLCLCLLFVLVKIPFWARQLAFGGRGASTTVRLAKVYAASKIVRTVI